MTTWQEAEEADQEAAERARVHEWTLEHPNPLTAALRRAENAEHRAAAMAPAIARAADTEHLAKVIFDEHVPEGREVPFVGTPREISIRAARAVQSYIAGGANP